MKLRPVVLAAAATLVVSSAGRGQDMPMPVDVQFSLFYRILDYDREAAVRRANGLVVGVIYQGGHRASVLARNEAVRQRPPDDATYPVRFVSIDLDVTPDLAQAVREAGSNVVYVTPLRAVHPSAIAAVTRSLGILTLTGVPSYVQLGLAVGIGSREDRPEILVNLSGSRAEGAVFSGQLLRLARVW